MANLNSLNIVDANRVPIVRVVGLSLQHNHLPSRHISCIILNSHNLLVPIAIQHVVILLLSIPLGSIRRIRISVLLLINEDRV